MQLSFIAGLYLCSVSIELGLNLERRVDTGGNHYGNSKDSNVDTEP